MTCIELAIGTQLLHKEYGYGVVIELSEEKVIMEFESFGQKIFLRELFQAVPVENKALSLELFRRLRENHSFDRTKLRMQMEKAVEKHVAWLTPFIPTMKLHLPEINSLENAIEYEQIYYARTGIKKSFEIRSPECWGSRMGDYFP